MERAVLSSVHWHQAATHHGAMSSCVLQIFRFCLLLDEDDSEDGAIRKLEVDIELRRCLHFDSIAMHGTYDPSSPPDQKEEDPRAKVRGLRRRYLNPSPVEIRTKCHVSSIF